MDVENSVAERKPINVPSSPKRSSLNPSLTSSVDNVIYPPSHQYHYIQYYQQPVNHYANPISQTICQCSCSCGTQQMLQPQFLHQQTTNKPSNDNHVNTHDSFSRPQHSHQTSVDSQMVAAVIVHRQASGSNSSNDNNPNASDLPQKSQSETSLLNHSYQALKMTSNSLLNDNLSSDHSAKTTKNSSSSCDCDLECTCNSVANGDGSAGTISIAVNRKEQMKQQFLLSEAMLTADEITVSESDNNSSSVKRCERNKNRKSSGGIPHNTSSIADELNYHNANNIDIYSDGDAEAITEACLKETNGLPGAGTDPRPPLPPRPPPRPKTSTGSSMTARGRPGLVVKKYVVWCLLCGGFSCILGLLFLGVYFLLHSYTITVGNFETVPTFVPATLLILTGLCVMSLARRRNRYSYLIKLSGACGLISALTCALVTVTTTVLHMSRLQALRECEYAQKTRTCTCYSDLIESQVDRVDKGAYLGFDKKRQWQNFSSVVFSCPKICTANGTIAQLPTHCNVLISEGVRLVFDSLSDCGVVHGSLYSCLRAIFGLSVAGVLVAVFSCMLVYQLLSHERKKMYWEQLELRCRSLYTRPQMPPQNLAAIAAPHGCRCCEQCHAHRQVPLQAAAYPWDESSEPRFWSTQPPGNFYSPNPGGEDLMGMSNTCRRHELTTSRSRGSGWSWHRWWQRSSPDPNSRFRQTPSSPDSQYGFSNTTTNAVSTMAEDVNAVVSANQQQYNVLPGNLPYGVWGPPPPYSDPNSPARRGYYQYIQPAHLHATAGGTAANVVPLMNANITDASNGVFIDQPAASSCCQQNIITRSSASTVGSVSNFKSKVEYENTPSDSDCGSNIRERDRFSNTLPTRKIKKRLDPGNKSIGPNSQSAQRINLEQVFSPITDTANDQQYQEPHILADDMRAKPQKLNNKCGVENTGFQNSCESTSPNMGQEAVETSDPTESEVYFADVSSCCNMSVKNDHYYEDARASQRTLIPAMNQQQAQPQQQLHNHSHSHSHHHHHQLSSCSSTTNEDYLAQRFGQRENSIRSRLPFPQSSQCTIEGSFVDNIQILETSVQDHTNLNCHSSHLPKDPSCQSMCSMESDAKTEFTDLSPLTPCGQNLNQLNDFAEITSQGHSTPTNFVSSSYPYSSESQSVEALRRSTKNLTEAHYEVIDDQQQLTPSLPQTQTQQQPSSNRIASGRTAKQPKTQAKSSLRERKDNSDREWSDASTGDRHRL